MITVIQLVLRNQLLTLTGLEVSANGQTVTIDDVVIDTGSAGTLLNADLLDPIGVRAGTGLQAIQIFGVGGSEHVFTHEVGLAIGTARVDPFIVEVGNMQAYGTGALIGLDFLLATGAIIDLQAMTLTLRA